MFSKSFGDILIYWKAKIVGGSFYRWEFPPGHGALFTRHGARISRWKLLWLSDMAQTLPQLICFYWFEVYRHILHLLTFAGLKINRHP